MKCIVPSETKIQYTNFDLLINQGHGGKLIWKSWRSNTAGYPKGRVSVDGVSMSSPYVARMENPHRQQNHSHHNYYDYFIGIFDPSMKMGRIIVNRLEQQMESKEGDILTEIEPVRYDLREITYDEGRKHETKNRTILGKC